MLFPKNTRPTSATRRALIDFIEELFKKEPYKQDIGKKVLNVISPSENEPSGPYIRIHKLNGREPWCMGDGEITWNEYQFEFLLDVRTTETDQQAPDKDGPNININSYRGKKKLSDEGDITENICDSLADIFAYNSIWKDKLSSSGIHNAILKDERETYSGTEYQNPMRLSFNAYVQT